MYHTIGEPLRAHVVEMVGGLKFEPVLLQLLVLDAAHLGREVVQGTIGIVRTEDEIAY